MVQHTENVEKGKEVVVLRSFGREGENWRGCFTRRGRWPRGVRQENNLRSIPSRLDCVLDLCLGSGTGFTTKVPPVDRKSCNSSRFIEDRNMECKQAIKMLVNLP